MGKAVSMAKGAGQLWYNQMETLMGRTLLLTGRPGVGKTTVIQTIAASLGHLAGGFTSEEMRGPGGRQGFRLVTLNGQEAVMAHVDLRESNRPRVGRYGVDVRAIERVGVAAVREAMQAGQIVVIDEIGSMELFCGPFKDIVLKVIGSPHTLLATVMSKPNPWVDSLRALPQVTVWEVTIQNREQMAQRVLQWLKH